MLQALSLIPSTEKRKKKKKTSTETAKIYADERCWKQNAIYDSVYMKYLE
jgi:hypothetical protein